MKLHEIIQNFYIKHFKPIFQIEVLSENNTWNVIDSVNITEKQYFYQIKTKTLSLLCTKNHILIDKDNNELLAVDSLGKLIKTKNGIEQIIDVVKTDKFDHAYDLSLHDDTDHLYYANSFLSHNCCIIDEMAFIPKNVIDEFFASVMPVVSSAKDSKVIVVSTPNGADPANLYYNIWQQANSGNSKSNKEGWKPFRIDYWEVPGRTPEWKEKQIASIGTRKFAQEFGNEFLSDGTTNKLLPDDVLERYRMKLGDYKDAGIKPKKVQVLAQSEDKVFEFEMWDAFDRRHTYMASADIAEGVGGDSSVLYIWDISDLLHVKLCAKFGSNVVSTVEFAFVCQKMLGLYGNPYLFAERNGISGAMLDSLRITYGYQNIAHESKNGEPGIYSHVTVKERATMWCREMMTTQGFGFEIYDKDLIDELGMFVKKQTKGMHTIFNAASGAHDDHVMAFIWACWALNKDLVEKYFIVCGTFTTVYGDTMPKLLQPQNPYPSELLQKIAEDPVYRDFLEFKGQNAEMAKAMTSSQPTPDTFSMPRYTEDDLYFGGGWDGPSWNGRQTMPATVNPNNIMPSFFVS